MFVTVVHERIHLDEGLVAHLAVIWPLSFFEAYVQSDVRRAHKGAAADATFQILCVALCSLRLAERWCTNRRWRWCWFGMLRGLLSLVREQKRQRPKPCATLLTNVRFLPGVETNVCQQPSLLGEGLVTVAAAERLLPCVESTVRLQMRSPTEGLPALGAFKRPVSAVDGLVSDQVGSLLEELATDVASELPLLHVGGQVEAQVGGGDEGFGADGAAVRVQVLVGSPAV